MENKVYIFVSHSHYDIEKVRVIRNYLEEIGTEPILFFLKSKTDANEITQLIKDEIDARLWFIYCRSENSENSKWVATELEYIKETNKENSYIIELDKVFNEKGELLDSEKNNIQKHLTVIKSNQNFYISYSPLDETIVQSIKNYMCKFGITFRKYEEDFSNNWAFTAMNNITTSKYFLIVVTKNSLNSEFIKDELKYAYTQKRKILPVIVDDCNIMDNDNFKYILNICWFNFDSNNIEKSCNQLMYTLISMQE